MIYRKVFILEVFNDSCDNINAGLCFFTVGGDGL